MLSKIVFKYIIHNREPKLKSHIIKFFFNLSEYLCLYLHHFSLSAALFSLAWWQFPLLFVGIFLCISGPSMFLAWLKLRRRTLGPVLDASGWAVNSQIPINFILGSCLTDAAALPPNASRSFDDPFRKQSRWKKWAVALGVVCLAALLAGGGYWGWKEYQKRHPAKQEQTSDITAPKAPAPSAK